MRLCNLFLQSVQDGKVDPHFMFFYDDAWFSLPGEVNSQNNQYSSAESPELIHELPLHDENRGVRCVTGARRVIGCIFHGERVNTVIYTNNILRPFAPS
jgi:hypothetical protein